MSALVSIIVVAFNEARLLARLRDSVSRLRRPQGIEVETIVVDGGSTDGSVEVARRCGFDQVIELSGASIPVCRNRGLAAAHGVWIAFVDGDCELAPDWLEVGAFFLEREPELILGWPAEPPQPGTWVQRAWHLHWMHKNHRLEAAHGRPVVRAEGFRLVTTRNMLLHRSVADRMKGFDERLPTGEDTDFVFRAAMSGVPVWGAPGLRVIHHGEPATLRQWFRQQLWHANRRSYQTILRQSGMRSGGRAPLFTAVFLTAALLAIAALVLAAAYRCPWWLTLAAPLVAVVGLPALRMAARARSPGALLPLGVLYAAYGLARAIDLLGLSRGKASWKSR